MISVTCIKNILFKTGEMPVTPVTLYIIGAVFCGFFVTGLKNVPVTACNTCNILEGKQ
ncbi:MAG: hypothetical protein JXA38_05130 [Methanosarcinaceae archaeon]|nr:hypothetical protein [Methanosarcinaceae archaeon]